MARHPRQPAGEVHRILAALQHAHQVVERRVRVGPAYRFVQRGDEVVVLVSIAVVGPLLL